MHDPNIEWLGHIQPVGLVVAPVVLARQSLVPVDQARADTEEVAALLTPQEDAPALSDPWLFLSGILGWQPAQVAGAPGGPTLPDDLSVLLPESETYLGPNLAVSLAGGGWQILVRTEAASIEPDARGALAGWEATPHQRLERLLRETGVPTGILLTDHELRLVHAPRGETSGWLSFPLRGLGSVAGRPMLGGLKLLLSSFRLHNDSTDRRLPALLKASREAQAEVSSKLATQVLGALHELLRGLHAADAERIERLTQLRSSHVYEGLLTVLLRLIFLLYAEDRNLIPSRVDGPSRALYAECYGVRTLHARLLGDKARNPDTMEERRGAWSRLLAVFNLVHAGDGSGWIRRRGGKLFNPAEFPFLQGQDAAEDHPAPAPLSDGCVLRVLDLLLTLDGERLSYRTLDVEQIGSVYETVMGFTVLVLPHPAIAIKAGKNNRTPVFVDLAALAATKPGERVRFLKEKADRGQVADSVARALAAATDAAMVAEALRPIVDERASPGGQPVAAGRPLLQPTDERRRTGSHYTPRTLTNPIVQHALAPVFARLGEDARPEKVLALKLCDIAMGSGAFLVEACRQIAARLVQSWVRHPDTRPTIPEDEDEDLLARRLVAQRCLYGVDKNPMAVDLARLSLWLATLARDHEFTFLDHALKSGDSLVGLTAPQISGMRWQDGQSDIAPFDGLLRQHVAQALRARMEIQNAPDDIARAIQEQRHRAVEALVDQVRLIGDAVVAAFFSADKPRTREAVRIELGVLISSRPDVYWPKLAERAAILGHDPHPIRPFHWPLEFPEVFTDQASGFDAIVGNPPFAGKNTLIGGTRHGYLDWLQTIHEGSHGNADLVAHFFRRAFGLLHAGGCLGLIATNTIGQGDTRESGLRWLLGHGGSVLRALRRVKWPGEAAVVISVVHVVRGQTRSPVLDGRQVRRISAYLEEGDLDASPAALVANANISFQGCIILGAGFTFDDEAANGKASSLAEMRRLIEHNPRNAERIFPYLGGEEVNTDPCQAHRRYVVDFNDFPLRRESMEHTWAGMTPGERSMCRRTGVVPEDYPDQVAEAWPDLVEILERLVKPEIANKRGEATERLWWQFLRPRPALRMALSGRKTVFVINCGASPHMAWARVSANQVYAHSLVVSTLAGWDAFAMLQSRVSETWTRCFGSSMKDDLRYTPSDCFETFPFAKPGTTTEALKCSGASYHDHRAKIMTTLNQGLTKTYNRFHDRAKTEPDIVRLRELQTEMDAVVLRAFGWDDLADAAAPEFLDENNENEHCYQGRLFWPAPFRDQVLGRLLALNDERAREERRLGLSPHWAGEGEKDDKVAA